MAHQDGGLRIAFINMTNTSYNCPTGLNLTSYSKRTCGRSHTNDEGCSVLRPHSVLEVYNIYSQVCGRIRGYQFGATDGLYDTGQKNIDGYYAHSMSLTHGGVGRRQHIWTFIAGISEYLPIHLAPQAVLVIQ